MKTVRSFIQKNAMSNLYTVGPGASILLVLKKMKKYNVGALPVVGENNKLLGIFSERDFSRACSNSRDLPDLMMPVSSIMTPVERVTTVSMETGIDECSARMDAKKVRHLPVVDKLNNVIAMISMRDLFRAMVKQHQEVLDNLAASMEITT